MDLKGAVLFCVILAFTNALEQDISKETTPQDKENDGNKAGIDESVKTNKRLDDILARMERLEAREKAREKTYMNEIKSLRRKLLLQTRRTSALERLVKSMTNTNPSHVNNATDAKEETSDGTEKWIEAWEEQPHNVKQSQRIRRMENENKVAFFAILDHQMTHVGLHQPIGFNKVVTNIGNAYNSHFGSFIAPVPGTYVFSATLFSDYHYNYSAQFAKNGQAITNIYLRGSDSGHATMSQTIVLQLQKGDDVSVQTSQADKSIHGDHTCTFSGFLLQEDFSNVAVVGK